MPEKALMRFFIQKSLLFRRADIIRPTDNTGLL